MTNVLLRIDNSILGERSVSRSLTDQVVAKLAPSKIIERDLSGGVPQIGGAWVGANFTPADERSDSQREALALSDSFIAEMREADTVVIGLPIYNFGVPATFKAWFDQIARAGVTFKYTDTGPVGLLTGKRAIIVYTSGGTEMGSDIDFGSAYVRHLLGFIGITDVEFVHADRMQMTPEESLETANREIAALAA